jgi:hypothetical protein
VDKTKLPPVVFACSRSNQAAWNTSSEPHVRSHTPDVESGLRTTTPSVSQLTPILCFSIVTEGPVHELWVHFEHEDAFQMEFLQSWRTARKQDARGLVHFLAQIMAWGRGRLKDAIVEKLDKVPKNATFG